MSIPIGTGKETNLPAAGYMPDRDVIDGSDALRRALWKHHPRILRRLGAVPVT